MSKPKSSMDPINGSGCSWCNSSAVTVLIWDQESINDEVWNPFMITGPTFSSPTICSNMLLLLGLEVDLMSPVCPPTETSISLKAASFLFSPLLPYLFYSYSHFPISYSDHYSDLDPFLFLSL